MLRAGARALALLAAFSAPAAAQSALNPGGRPPILSELGVDQRIGAQLPLEAEFRDEDGRTVRLGEFFAGKRPVVLALVYYECPMLCTLVLNGLTASLRTLSLSAGEDFEVVAVSFAPGEGPALAAAKRDAYVASYGRGGRGWHFLTGGEGAIRALTSAAGFKYAYDANRRQYAHPSLITVATPGGKVARYLFGTEFSARDLRLALVEASEGKVGTVIDQVLLFCYAYDPAAGKYGAAVMGLVRAGGALTLIALGAWLAVQFRRERKRKGGDACPA
jgi:protein SCO1/2